MPERGDSHEIAHEAAQKRLAQTQEQERRRQRRGERIQAWLTDKWGLDRACPYCGAEEWSFDSEPRAIAMAREPQRGIYAYAVRCENCGNLVLLSAEVLGLESDEDL
jgi:DNA-directed RNA polymerase subunit RPC12/RpoP